MQWAFAAVSPTLRLERAAHTMNVRAELLDEFCQHMIRLDVDGAARDLGRRVTITKVPGYSRQSQGIVRVDFEEILGGSFDEHGTTLDGKTIAVSEIGSLGQIEEQIASAIRGQQHTAAIARLAVERNAVDNFRRCELTNSHHGRCAQGTCHIEPQNRK